MRHFLLYSMALAAGTATAQTHWVNPLSGNWSNPVNWSPADVPDSPGESAVIAVPGSYTVSWDINAGLGGLTIAASGAAVDLNAGRAMFYSGSALINDGLFTINPSGGNSGTYMRLDTGACMLSGSGTLRLNSFATNLDTAQLTMLNGGYVLTNAAGHLIDGTGRVRVRLMNQGEVRADVPGAILELSDEPKTNTAMMRATDGGILQFISTILTNSGGQLVSSGTDSRVNLVSSSISGGSISAVNGGVASSANSSLSGITITGPFYLATGTLSRLVDGGITNNGTFLINPSGDNSGTYLRIDAPSVTIDGAGTVELNAYAGNLDTAHIATLNGTYVMTVGDQQSIRGTGRVRVAADNYGAIRADVPTAVLELSDYPKTNNGLMEAIDGSTLRMAGVTVDNLNGLIRARAASTVSLSNATVSGGLLAGMEGGVISLSGSTLSGLTAEGLMELNAGTVLYLAGDITNNADFTINPTGANSGTYLRLDAPSATISGTGAVHLNADPTNLDTGQITTLNGGYALGLGADQTIDGVGRIRVRMTNEGTIDANSPGNVLELTQFAKVNNAVMRASNGGILRFADVEVDNNAEISSHGAGASVIMNNTSLTGGTLASREGASNLVQNSTFADVTIDGLLGLSPGTVLLITGTELVNNGVLTVNPTGANSATYIRLDSAAAAFRGRGVIRLNANPQNLDTAQLAMLNGGYTLTNAVDHTIVGCGRIRVRVRNEGLVEADVPGAALDLSDTQKTNMSTMRARNGGALTFNSVAVENSGGLIAADGASSIVGLYGTSLIGGTLAGANGGVTQSSNSTFDGVAIEGPHDVLANSVLYLHGGGIVNKGMVTINSTAGNAYTYLRLDAPTATIGGDGDLILNADPTNLDTAHLSTINGAYALTLGPALTLAGNGRVRVHAINQGRLSPGSAGNPAGTIDILGYPWTQTAAAQYAVDLGGLSPSDYDRLTGNALITLDGTLLIGLTNGFTPAYGSEFTIISCGSLTGTFADVYAPALGGDNRWRVRYGPTSATLVVTCNFDLDGDLSVGLQDLAILLAHFGTQDGAVEREGDLDSDGDVDIQDLADLLGRFGTTCH